MAAAKSAIGAGKHDITDLEPVKPADPRVIEIGQFAVTKHNEEAGTELVFICVVGGFMWGVIGGAYYALIIETQDSSGATFLQKALVFAVPTAGMRLIWYKN
ncbi:cysteine proteinase inhibitor 5 [Coffea arabica]|uniref:Cysteine proteinase inhibitor 5 n=1 Tax=Coffea arabica TaxID=13443 RepID=A0A6P6X002_COFAR|nr:cysteine proteinase inhibitor 5-like [Coffea arabica]